MRRPPRAAVCFGSFNKQNTSLIVRLDVIEKRLMQLEEEIAEYGRQWKLLTSAPDTGDLSAKAKYLDALTTYFSEDELNTLAFELGVDWDGLPASGSHGKARELMEYLERRDKLTRLYEKVRQERPFLDLS